MAARLTLIIIFGGVSSEHEISRISAASILQHINREKYYIKTIGITKNGKWYLTEASADEISDGSWERNVSNKAACILTDYSRQILVSDGSKIKADVVFPVLHGKNGEDGTIQGLLQLADIPFVGSDAAASAACMDKAITKAVIEHAGVCAQADCCVIHRGRPAEEHVEFINNHFNGEYPLFVKPANAGSSVGITKVKLKEELPNAVNTAFAEDSKAVAERAVTGREIEVGVLGNSTSVCWIKEVPGRAETTVSYDHADNDNAPDSTILPRASRIGEIFAAHEFYDYEAKYNDEVGSKTGIVSDLCPQKDMEIRNTAVRIYEALGCDGLARVDFFLEKGADGSYDSGRLVFNEINTLPGFTSISMYPMLWEAAGLPYDVLIDRLIELALIKTAG